MKNLMLSIFYLALYAGLGYLLLKVFTKLSGVDMFAAVSWGFKAKKFEIVLPMMLLYLIAAVMFLSIITSPLHMITAGSTQKGGLLGYQDDDNIYRYYEPVDGKYYGITHYNPPPAAEKINDLFRVVSFYKPLFSEYYRNVTDLSFLVSIIKIIFFIIGAVPLYFVLILLAKEFADFGRVSAEISHKAVSANFLKILGINFNMFIAFLFFMIVIIITAGHLISKKISAGQIDVFRRYSSEYRNEILRDISAGDKIQGAIIRRAKSTIKRYPSSDGRVKVTYNERNVVFVFVPAKIYTIEFNDILNFPFYMNLEFVEENVNKADIDKLDSFFPDNKSSKPVEKKEMNFIVYKDYTLSLAPM